MTTRSGSPRERIRRPLDVGLDDVAAVDALLDAVPHLADEHRRVGAQRGSGSVPDRSEGSRAPRRGSPREDTAHGGHVGAMSDALIGTRWSRRSVGPPHGGFSRVTTATVLSDVSGIGPVRCARRRDAHGRCDGRRLPSGTAGWDPWLDRTRRPRCGVRAAIPHATDVPRCDRRVHEAGDEREADLSRGLQGKRPGILRRSADRRVDGRVRRRLRQHVHIRHEPRIRPGQDPRPGSRREGQGLHQVRSRGVADHQGLRRRVFVRPVQDSRRSR